MQFSNISSNIFLGVVFYSNRNRKISHFLLLLLNTASMHKLNMTFIKLNEVKNNWTNRALCECNVCKKTIRKENSKKKLINKLEAINFFLYERVHIKRSKWLDLVVFIQRQLQILKEIWVSFYFSVCLSIKDNLLKHFAN